MKPYLKLLISTGCGDRDVEHKTQYQRKDEHTPEEFYDRAGIWAVWENYFCGVFFVSKGDIRNFRVTSFFEKLKF
jgi:hypothetical protein